MKGDALVALLDAVMERLRASRDELRDLDAALGDGDLGITVEKGCDAVRSKLAELTEPAPAQVIRAAGAAFAGANPSTMAALVRGGLLAGAKALADTPDLMREDVVRFARAVVDSISMKGKAELGDKTMLDALVPSVVVLENSDGDDSEVLAAMVDAAHERWRRPRPSSRDAGVRRGSASVVRVIPTPEPLPTSDFSRPWLSSRAEGKSI